jgi:hypothetical protein
VVAGSGSQGASAAPAGAYYYDLDTSIAANKLTGNWRGVWATTGPVAKTDFSFQVIDRGAP